MARGSNSALAGLAKLAKLAEERKAFEVREAQLRAEAAVEIGTVMLGAGAERIELRMLEKIVRRAAELGGSETLKRLDARAV